MKSLDKFVLFLFMSLVAWLPGQVFASPLGDMISPISNPVNFEDPRINTELRPIFAYHKIDDNFVTSGGDVQLYALQFRGAITDRLAFIATKDGFIDFNPDAALTDETGFANLAAGFKYAFYMDEAAGQIATVGLRYEIPSGNRDVLQGEGDGSFNPFLSVGTNFEGLNIIAGTGFRFAIASEDSSFYDFDLHIDKQIGNFYPTAELNVVHVLDAGERLGIADEGQDLFNFGSTEAGDKTLVTAAVGARYRICDNWDAGLSYQFPLTGGAGSNIIDWRLVADMIVSFSFL